MFDVVSYAPGNVTDTNKVFALSVSDDSIAYVDGHTVIIRNATEITTFISRPAKSFAYSVA